MHLIEQIWPSVLGTFDAMSSSTSSPTQPINIRRSTDDKRSKDGDSEPPALSESALAALNEFLLEAQAAAQDNNNPFSENWGLSQVAGLQASPGEAQYAHRQL